MIFLRSVLLNSPIVKIIYPSYISGSEYINIIISLQYTILGDYDRVLAILPICGDITTISNLPNDTLNNYFGIWNSDIESNDMICAFTTDIRTMDLLTDNEQLKSQLNNSIKDRYPSWQFVTIHLSNNGHVNMTKPIMIKYRPYRIIKGITDNKRAISLCSNYVSGGVYSGPVYTTNTLVECNEIIYYANDSNFLLNKKYPIWTSPYSIVNENESNEEDFANLPNFPTTYTMLDLRHSTIGYKIMPADILLNIDSNKQFFRTDFRITNSHWNKSPKDNLINAY
jgi:hypothetical protein